MSVYYFFSSRFENQSNLIKTKYIISLIKFSLIKFSLIHTYINKIYKIITQIYLFHNYIILIKSHYIVHLFICFLNKYKLHID